MLAYLSIAEQHPYLFRDLGGNDNFSQLDDFWDTPTAHRIHQKRIQAMYKLRSDTAVFSRLTGVSCCLGSAKPEDSAWAKFLSLGLTYSIFPQDLLDPLDP